MGNFFFTVMEVEFSQSSYYDPTGSDMNVCLSIGDEEAIILPIRNVEPVSWDDEGDAVDTWCMTQTLTCTHAHCE